MSLLCAYHEPATTFLQHCAAGEIADRVGAQVIALFDCHYKESEYRSWQASLPALGEVLKSAGVLDVDVFVELQMPRSSERCDVLLVGLSEDGKRTALLLELKQWSLVHESIAADKVVMMGQLRLHPARQATGYADWLKGYHGTFGDGELALVACAYLHNLSSPRPLEMLRSRSLFGPALDLCPLFAKPDRERFEDFVRRKVGHGRVPEARRLILDGRLVEAKNLLALLVQTIEDNEKWILLKEQQIVFDTVVTLVNEARARDLERPGHLIVVRGGPGTGKSVLAIQLLAYGARNGWRVAHATGSKAFRTVLQAKVAEIADRLLKRIYNARYKKDIPVEGIFTTFQDIATLGAKHGRQLDVVVGDEGHRLWTFRQNVRTRQALSDVPMIEEMLRASPVTVMFLDDNQSIRANEIGSVQYLTEHANRVGLEVEVLELETQFRCGGSVSYLHWIENRMGFDRPPSLAWRQYGGYDFRIFTDVAEMQRTLASAVKDGQRCRMVAGFCWRWSKPRLDGTLEHDIRDPRLGAWTAPWIEKSEPDAALSEHRYYRWVEDDAYFAQVGSIYSVQGFEFDYVGVIVGDDLVVRDGRWVAELRNNKDGQFKDDLKRSGKLAEPVDAATRLRNIYQVLLTRAMKGTFVFFLDDETRRHFERGLAGV
jgi:DUF2075 family protein